MTIECIDVSKFFGSKRVLDAFRFRAKASEVTWLCGPSGSGKSTVMSLLGLLSRPDSGTILLDGTAISGLSDADSARVRARQIGFVFQQNNLFVQLSASENIAIASIANKAETQQRTAELINKVGLADRSSVMVNRLSGGEQQRIAVARALVNRPEVILADEPISGLDADNARGVLDLLVDAANAGAAVIISSHDVAVERIAEQRVELNKFYSEVAHA